MKVLVLKGEGLNCERETAQAFERFGATADIRHVRELISTPQMLLQYQILAMPGGFSYGDEIQSGHILGMALKNALQDSWQTFMKRKGLVIGICNGFQTLMKMGAFESERTLALVHNHPHGFQDRWVNVSVYATECVWTQGMAGETLALPIRHGEGRIWSATGTINAAQVVLSYETDVNGSLMKAAGITDVSGQILGLMPHPEAALENWLLPERSLYGKETLNQKIFLNALNFVKENHYAMAN